MAKTWMEKTYEKMQKEREKTHKAANIIFSLCIKHNTNLSELKTIKNWPKEDQKSFLKAMQQYGYKLDFVNKYC